MLTCTMDQRYHPVLTYTLYFPRTSLPAKGLERLDGLDRDMIYKMLCRLKMTLSRSGERNDHYPFFDWFVTKLPEQHGERLRGLMKSCFITTALVVNQLLVDLFRAAEPVVVPELERPDYISLAILETLMIYNDHHFRALGIGTRPDDHDLLWQIMMMQDLNGTNSASFVRTGAMKQAIFLNYLENLLQDQFPAFEEKLCNKLGVPRLGEVSLVFVRLQVAQDDALKTKDPLISIPPDMPLHLLLNRLELVTDPADQSGGFSIFKLMMKPFIRLQNNYLAFTGVHDFTLISSLGWGYFLFNEGTLKPYIPKFARANFQAFYGRYVEKFLLGKLFRSLHQKGFRAIASDDEYTADMTLILNETDVFLIEIKTSALHYQDWQDQDLGAFKAYLDRSFISDKKGLIQLHKCLQHLADDAPGLVALHSPLRKLKIYPVIVYTEPHAGSVGVNDYLKNNGPALPADLAARFHTIQPLTMIDADFFVENIRLLRNNKRLLKAAILRYHSGTTQRKKQWRKNNSTFNFSKAMQSFDNYNIGYEGLYQEDQMDIADEIKAVFHHP